MSELLIKTIRDLSEGIKNKKISSVELVNFYLDRIRKYDVEFNSYLTVNEDCMKGSDTSKQSQNKSLLFGIPAGIKDVIATKDIRLTGGSKILENYISPYDATVVGKLNEVGYVLLGKHNCDEFAQGSSNENSGYGPVKNPWDKSRVPGGTSGGSATAVAAGFCHYALGTDTGGSIRQPASYCGVVGLKPTYGRVSRYGLMSMTSSFDQCGVLSRRVEDAKEVLRVIEGEDTLDATSAQAPEMEDKLETLKGVRVGVPKEYFTDGLNEGVKKIIESAIGKFEELGASIVEVSLPNFQYALATYYITMFAEISSNMARYDGVRYGISQVDNKGLGDLEDLYRANRALLGEEVKRRIMLGTYVLSSGYYDAYYGKAQQVRDLIIGDFRKVFDNVDVLAGPVAPTPAFGIGEHLSDPLAMYLEDVYTVPVNLAGLPALSVPAGFVSGLPVGLHLIGKWWEDDKLLEIARMYEIATEYYKQRPKL